MNKKISILLAVTALACLTACKAESYSTSETNVHLSTTKDGETTENDLSSEVSYGLSSGEADENTADEVESTDAKYDSAAYDLNYYVNDDGIYYVEIAPTVKEGDAQAIIGHYTLDSSEEAVDFAVIDVTVENGQVTGVTDSGFTDDLSDFVN